MRAHVEAIKALLTPLCPTYFVEVPGAPVRPYVLLWAGAGTPGVEASIDDVRNDIDTLVGVTGVGDTPEAALAVLAKVRTVLAPGGSHATLTVAGRSATLRLFDSRPVQPDADVTIPATNRHPSYGVDLYRLVSTPA